MPWGSILTQVATKANPVLGAGVSFISNILNEREQSKKAKQAENEYYASLAQQRELAALSAQTASQRAAFEAAMKERILTQNGELGSTLRAAQRNMGAMPQFNEDTINQDYSRNKATMMQDFNDMLTLVESQGRAAQIERLGGAGSTAATNDRMNALIKRFTPELQKIDDAAYDAAINRSQNKMTLINTNRSNTLNELKDTLQPQITNDMGLLTQGGTDITTLTNSNANYTNRVYTDAANEATAKGDTEAKIDASLADLLSKVFNRPNNDDITRNGPRWTGGATK